MHCSKSSNTTPPLHPSHCTRFDRVNDCRRRGETETLQRAGPCPTAEPNQVSTPCAVMSTTRNTDMTQVTWPLEHSRRGDGRRGPYLELNQLAHSGPTCKRHRRRKTRTRPGTIYQLAHSGPTCKRHRRRKTRTRPGTIYQLAHSGPTCKRQRRRKTRTRPGTIYQLAHSGPTCKQHRRRKMRTRPGTIYQLAHSGPTCKRHRRRKTRTRPGTIYQLAHSGPTCKRHRRRKTPAIPGTKSADSLRTHMQAAEETKDADQTWNYISASSLRTHMQAAKETKDADQTWNYNNQLAHSGPTCKRQRRRKTRAIPGTIYIS